MTVLLLKPYATFAQGATIDLDNATEASLVAQGLATYTANLGATFLPLTAAEQQAIRDGGGETLSQAQRWVAAFAPRSPVESWCLQGGGVSLAGAGQNGWTWQNTFATRNKAYAFRMAYLNVGTGTFTVDKTTITPSSTYVLNGDPTGGVTPVNVTFSGSASVTTVAAASAAETTFAQSDWMLVNPLDRTDVVNAPCMWHHRAFLTASTGLGYQNTLSSLTYAGASNVGLVRSGNAMVGDKIATPAGFVGTLGQGFMMVCAYEFRGVSRTLRLGVIGDSIAAGTESVGAQYLNSYAEGACNIVNNNLASSASISNAFWSSMNFGWPSQNYTQITARMPSILAAYPVDAMVIPVWSPNSSPSDAATTSTNIGQTLDMIARCIAARVVPILATMPPRNSYGTTNDNPRKTINALFRNVAASRGYPLVDFDLLMSDQATPAQLLPNMSTDGLHPSAAGKAAMQQALAAVLPYAASLT